MWLRDSGEPDDRPGVRRLAAGLRARPAWKPSGWGSSGCGAPTAPTRVRADRLAAPGGAAARPPPRRRGSTGEAWLARRDDAALLASRRHVGRRRRAGTGRPTGRGRPGARRPARGRRGMRPASRVDTATAALVVRERGNSRRSLRLLRAVASVLGEDAGDARTPPRPAVRDLVERGRRSTPWLTGRAAASAARGRRVEQQGRLASQFGGAPSATGPNPADPDEERQRAQHSKTDAAPTGGRRLVIVESPAKAQDDRGLPRRRLHVEASVGHIRDLPDAPPSIPAEYEGPGRPARRQRRQRLRAALRRRRRQEEARSPS